MSKARIKLASVDINKINKVCDEIKEVANKTGIPIKGPIPLPTKKLKIVTRKSVCGDGTATWERYELRIHKRILDLAMDERTLRLIMRIHVPQNLNIEIEMID